MKTNEALLKELQELRAEVKKLREQLQAYHPFHIPYPVYVPQPYYVPTPSYPPSYPQYPYITYGNGTTSGGLQA